MVAVTISLSANPSIKVLDTELFAQSGLDKQKLLLLVHSGLRGLGQSILRQYVEQHSHNGLDKNSDEAAASKNFWRAMFGFEP